MSGDGKNVVLRLARFSGAAWRAPASKAVGYKRKLRVLWFQVQSGLVANMYSACSDIASIVNL